MSEEESWNETYNSSKDKVEFEGRGWKLGEYDITNIHENPDKAGHEGLDGGQSEENSLDQPTSKDQD